MIITDKQEIEDISIRQNKIHLNQAQGTTCTVPPILALLGQDSFTTFGDQILRGIADTEDLPISNIQKILFLTLKRKKILNPSPLLYQEQAWKKVSKSGKKRIAHLPLQDT